jgi:hypothetical protein
MVYIKPQYITIYNTFISVGAQITTTDYDVVDVFEDTKVVIRKSKKDSKHNGQKKMDNWKKNDLSIKPYATKLKICFA